MGVKIEPTRGAAGPVSFWGEPQLQVGEVGFAGAGCPIGEPLSLEAGAGVWGGWRISLVQRLETPGADCDGPGEWKARGDLRGGREATLGR